MAADSKDWSSNANDALVVRVKHSVPAAKALNVQFHPNFTYPIFGNEETIFGYRGLRINLNFVADTLKPSLVINWDERYTPVGDTKPDDVDGTLESFLPALPSEPDAAPSGDGEREPPGELLFQYEVKGRTFGIWSAPLADNRAKEILRNMQILVLFFIEGGTYIELDDPEWTMARWRVFFLYAIDTLPERPNETFYTFAGYSTAYTLFFIDKRELDDATSLSVSPDFSFADDDYNLQQHVPSRSRISQFVILPPYQNAGHGVHLYNAMTDLFLAEPNVHEITVEDPNESFDDLRDHSDLIRLRSNPSFSSLSIDTNVQLSGKSQKLPTSSLLPPAIMKQLRSASKIPARQFARLVEMQLLSRIPPRNRNTARLTRKDKSSDENDRAYYFWRLLVKQRLYKHNIDSLSQLDLEERIEKLEETLIGVEKDYVRILEGVDRRAARVAEAVAMEQDAVNGTQKSGMNGKSSARSLKRRVVDDDDEDDIDDLEADSGDAADVNGHSSKRKKVAV